MACFSPQKAVRTDDGGVTFVPRGWDGRRVFELPCGQCIGCRLERSRQWAMRCMHESQMHALNCFVTLTFDEEHLPVDGSLDYAVFQRFMRDLRRDLGCWDVTLAQYVPRFYMCGEYGERTRRPHFHACLFGVDFPDRVKFKDMNSGFPIYTSKLLSSIWTDGFASVADFSFETAAYVARYVCKKVTGPMADSHYLKTDFETGEVFRLRPEFTQMSLKPGIGRLWFDKYHGQVYPRDYVIVRGRKVKPPKYYDKVLASLSDFRSDEVEYDRFVKALAVAHDNTPERLSVREICARARLSQKVRTLE